MTDINPTPSWAAVRQLEIGEFALGGANGNMNDQAKSSAARSEFLKQRAAYQYNTLAEANADIANIALNQNINVVDSGLYYKEIAGATSLTKSPHDPLTQAKKYADNLSANHVIKVADAISADASQNIYLSSNDIANFYISAQGSQYAGRINALAGTAMQVMSVKAGETYLFYAPTLTSILAVSFSKEDSVVALKQLTLAHMSTVSNSIKKVVVPANVN